ncbi:hypothetical protein HOD08_03705 [bacterium]|nr:hypothetical protein [bacterium]
MAHLRFFVHVTFASMLFFGCNTDARPLNLLSHIIFHAHTLATQSGEIVENTNHSLPDFVMKIALAPEIYLCAAPCSPEELELKHRFQERMIVQTKSIARRKHQKLRSYSEILQQIFNSFEDYFDEIKTNDGTPLHNDLEKLYFTVRAQKYDAILGLVVKSISKKMCPKEIALVLPHPPYRYEEFGKYHKYSVEFRKNLSTVHREIEDRLTRPVTPCFCPILLEFEPDALPDVVTPTPRKEKIRSIIFVTNHRRNKKQRVH